MQKRGYHDFRSKFCLTVPKNFVGEPFCVSKNFWYRKVLCIGGGHHGLVEKSFVSQDRNEKLGKGALLFSRKFLASKNFFGKSVGGGGCYHNFPPKIFCVTVPKNFVGGPFLVSKKFWYRKFSCIVRGGGFTVLSNFFVSQCRKFSLGNTSVFQKISGLEKFYA